ncbi:MAG: hypothetical protein VB071_03615 [Lawsonibacter sp.]|nr:hypothetical protein [Lawsonibacter sp.]
MKHIRSVLLALGFICSLAFYFWIWMPDGGPLAFPWPQLIPYLRPTFHAVPAFCLQLFLLRVTRNKLVRAIPLLLLAIPLSFALFYFVRNQTWDRLGALIFLFGAVAPAVGCALGWGVYELCRRKPD